MRCPRCENATLVEIDREGVVVDRCDRCRGLWLDRGELEKLTQRLAAWEASGAAPASYGSGRRDDDDDSGVWRRPDVRRDDDSGAFRRAEAGRVGDDSDYSRRPGYPPPKKRGFLDVIGGIFD